MNFALRTGSGSKKACIILLSSALLVTTSFGRDGVKVYRVPKEQRLAAANRTSAGLAPVSESALPQLSWKTPAGWTELPAGQMRVASFKVQDDGKVADVSVIPLPGAAGGDLPNVNRWRGQVGRGPVTEDEMTKSATKLDLAGQSALLHEMAGTNAGSSDPTRILSVIQHREGTAWFFKMIGDDQLVAKNRAAFLEFLKSVKFETSQSAELPANHPPIDPTELPPGHPEIQPATAGNTPATAGNTEVSSGRKLRWTLPAGWKETPAGQFLYAKFTIAGEGGAQAAVNVSTSSGDGGGLAANVNRWRGQLGQSPWGEAELQKQIKTIEVAGSKILLVEMNGTDARSGQPASLVGAVVSQGDSTWFYKLMGDAKVVAVQKDAFTRFVKDTKY